jgi:hypothetical protein
LFIGLIMALFIGLIMALFIGLIMAMFMNKMNRMLDSDWKRIGPYKSLFGKTTASGRFEELKDKK